MPSHAGCCRVLPPSSVVRPHPHHPRRASLLPPHAAARFSQVGVLVTLTFITVAFALGGGKTAPIVIVVAIFFYLVAYGIGMSTVPWIVVSEIYPTVRALFRVVVVRRRQITSDHARSRQITPDNAIVSMCAPPATLPSSPAQAFRPLCVSHAIFANWIFSFIVSQTFLNLCLGAGMAGAFATCTAISAGSLCLMWRYLPETKGVPLEEIGSLFDDPYPHTIHARIGPTEASKLVSGHSSDSKEASCWQIPNPNVLFGSCVPSSDV